MLLQVHELRKDGDAERLVSTALDAATLNPAEKTVDVFVAVGGDHTANAGANTAHLLCRAALRSAYCLFSIRTHAHPMSQRFRLQPLIPCRERPCGNASS